METLIICLLTKCVGSRLRALSWLAVKARVMQYFIKHRLDFIDPSVKLFCLDAMYLGYKISLHKALLIVRWNRTYLIICLVFIEYWINF